MAKKKNDYLLYLYAGYNAIVLQSAKIFVDFQKNIVIRNVERLLNQGFPWRSKKKY